MYSPFSVFFNIVVKKKPLDQRPFLQIQTGKLQRSTAYYKGYTQIAF